jgi:hypothetical protein
VIPPPILVTGVIVGNGTHGRPPAAGASQQNGVNSLFSCSTHDGVQLVCFDRAAVVPWWPPVARVGFVSGVKSPEKLCPCSAALFDPFPRLMLEICSRST